MADLQTTLHRSAMPARTDRPARRGPRSRYRMPGRAGTGHQGRGQPGHGFKDLVAGGCGLQQVRPDQCDEAPATDRSGRRQAPQRRRRLAGRQAFRVGRFPGRGLHEGHAAAEATGGDVVSVGVCPERKEDLM
jgi:hypothetical protein